MHHGPILVIDDEPQNLMAMRQVLHNHYTLAFANSGQAGIKAAKRLQPSLILLDICMPDLDGYQVCRALKRDPALENIPVIFVSSLSEAGDETHGFEAGAVDFIHKPISPSIVQARVRTHLSLVKTARLQESYRDAISMLGIAGHYNDTDTGVHIWRMAAYARALAARSGWSIEECRQLEMAAPMHDTGKIGIPEAILRKPGKLTADEWVVMKTHTQIGHRILSQSPAAIFQLAAEVALYHHEKWDGSGYPEGLSGADIPESARIVAIADVFDALTMKRPYKEAWPVERALETLHAGADQHFEGRLIDCFEAILPDILEIKQRWDAQEHEETDSNTPGDIYDNPNRAHNNSDLTDTVCD